MYRKTIMILLVLLLTANIAFAEQGDVQVKIPEFDIYLNNTLVDNTKVAYPMLEYKGVTYFPMTWEYSNALGLETSWSNDTGLSIKKNGRSGELALSGDENNKLGQVLEAEIANYDIQLNGMMINNSEEEYPILNYKSVTYFPLTWKFAVEAFDWTSEWNQESGLSVTSTQSTPAAVNPEMEAVETVVNLPFNIEFSGMENWALASSMIAEDAFDMGAKLMDISSEEIDILLKARVEIMELYSKFPLDQISEEGNPNLIFLVERNYAFDSFQTPEEYMEIAMAQLDAIGFYDTSEQATVYENLNGVRFSQKNVKMSYGDVNVVQSYFIAKEDSYFVSVIVSLPDNTSVESIKEIQQVLDTFKIY